MAFSLKNLRSIGIQGRRRRGGRLTVAGVRERKMSSGAAASGERVRCAFIGAGDISTLHYEGVQKCDNAELVGIWSLPSCSVVTDREAVARRYGCRLYATPEELVRDPGVEAVFVLTNMETHHDFAKMAMEAKKPVLVEKPVASSIEELVSLKAISQENNVAIMPGHNYIYEPWFDRTKDIVSNGDLGTIVATYVLFNIHHPPEFTGRDSMQGVIRQILTHHSYMAIYLMGGAPARVSAFSSCLENGSVEKENVAMVNMQMHDGALAHLQANFAADDHGADPWSVYVKVIGTKGTARYSYNDWVINAPHIIHSHTYVPYPHTIANEVKFFVDEVIGKGATPLSTIDDAISCQRILDAVEKSIEEDTHVVLDAR